MIGLDLSVGGPIWAAPRGREIVTGQLAAPDPAALRAAVRAVGVTPHELAIAVPTRDVVVDSLPRLSLSKARRAARLAAAQRLRIDPDAVVLSLDHTETGVMYVAAPHDRVAAWTDPWRRAGWRVRALEPVATAVLRTAGSDHVEVFVRPGPGVIDIIIGAQRRWVRARTVDIDWRAAPATVRVEVEDTIAESRKADVDPGGIAVLGAAPVLVDALTGLGPVRTVAPDPAAADAPAEAFAAIAMARWTAPPPRAVHPARSGIGGQWLRTLLSSPLWRRDRAS